MRKIVGLCNLVIPNWQQTCKYEHLISWFEKFKIYAKNYTKKNLKPENSQLCKGNL